jgi:cytochrome c peroxidase
MKNKFLNLFFGSLIISILWAFTLIPTEEIVQLVYPKSWPKPHYNFNREPLTKEKIALGRKLFYDPILSLDNTISCASCHLSYTAFTHVDHALSHGIYDSIGFRNSPVLINLAWNKHFMWDGAVNHIEVQALAPISDKREMAESFPNIINKLKNKPEYSKLFVNAFGNNEISSERILKSIAQFQLTLISANSKYDRVKKGLEKFNTQEENGYRLFQKNCNSCHQEPLFTNGNFENNGIAVNKKLNDFGRYRITLQTLDSMKFKVPTLRNIEFSHPYMHDGRFTTLNQVLNHYINGIESSENKSKELSKNLALNSLERIDIIAFLLTLSDKEFVFNAEFAYPRN